MIYTLIATNNIVYGIEELSQFISNLIKNNQLQDYNKIYCDPYDSTNIGLKPKIKKNYLSIDHNPDKILYNKTGNNKICKIYCPLEESDCYLGSIIIEIEQSDIDNIIIKNFN
jgi:hypothetical protein